MFSVIIMLLLMITVSLVNEEKQSGVYEFVFSPKSGSASGGDTYSLASGMYLFKLQAGYFVATKKMIHLR